MICLPYVGSQTGALLPHCRTPSSSSLATPPAGSETRDRQAKFEQRKAFQRLIYVSQLVFGDQKAAFLLPWRRVFGLNESQLIVARRSNAKEIFVQVRIIALDVVLGRRCCMHGSAAGASRRRYLQCSGLLRCHVMHPLPCMHV